MGSCWSALAPIVFANATAMRAQQPCDVLFVRISLVASEVGVAFGTETRARSADLKGLIEAESIVQELEADAASAVLMRWHWR